MTSPSIKTALSIAGSDPSGGAGIQADVKTMTANGVYAMAAVTALTAQNTTGIGAICDVSPDFLRLQLEAVFSDIPPDAVKIGMVRSRTHIGVIESCLQRHKTPLVVCDPILAASTGTRLLAEDAADALRTKLLPLAYLVTPNIPEAELLAGMRIAGKGDMEDAAAKLGIQFGCAVLIKGGHSAENADDLLFHDGVLRWYPGKRIENENTHGTGCTLSSAITANLAKGFPIEESVERAKEYVSGALGAMLNLGRGSGPLHHGFAIEGRFSEEKKRQSAGAAPRRMDQGAPSK